jgi:hypothetical protein
MPAYWEQALTRPGTQSVREHGYTIHFFQGGICTERNYKLKCGDKLPVDEITYPGSCMMPNALEHTTPKCVYCASPLVVEGPVIPGEHRCRSCGSSEWEGRYFETAMDQSSPGKPVEEKEPSKWGARLGMIVFWVGVIGLAHLLCFDAWLLQFARAIGYGIRS